MSATLEHTDPPTGQQHPHQDRIDQLRGVADWLERHPQAHVSGYQVHYGADDAHGLTLDNYAVNTPAELAEAVREIGGRWDKRVTEHGAFYVTQTIASGVAYRLVALREQVCQRVVTGTETRTVSEPDPDAVATLPTVERTETVETVEWRCAPILVNATEA